jgi:arylsulfatase
MGIRQISRRSFLRTTVLGSAAIAGGVSLRARTAGLLDKPSLVVFLPDDLRADTILGANAGVHAPNLHRLASQSVAFERAYVTQPICAPSRSSLLSGTWPHQNGCLNNHGVLARKFRCLPEFLADSDYHCGYFGKWHLGDEFLPQRGFTEWASITESFKPIEPHHHRDHWYDRWISLVAPSSGAHRDPLPPKASDYTRFLISKGYRPDAYHGRYFSERFSSRLPFELSKAKFVETKACEFLERHSRFPFVMFVGFFEPHPPYYGPFNDEHPIESIQLDPTIGEPLNEDVPLRYRIREENYRRKFASRDDYRRIKQRYFGLITEIDHCIGNILEKTQNLGIAGRTIIVLTSDHGDMMGTHGLLGKGVMYENAVTVPYVVSVPGISPRRISQPVSHIDFVPTVLDLLGKKPDPQCAGRSRAALLRGESMPVESVFIEWSPGHQRRDGQTNLANKESVSQPLSESTRAIVTPDRWKLCLRDKDKNELYNLQEDPDERKNLYSDSTQRDTVKRLTNEIHEWQQRVGDTLKV